MEESVAFDEPKLLVLYRINIQSQIHRNLFDVFVNITINVIYQGAPATILADSSSSPNTGRIPTFHQQSRNLFTNVGTIQFMMNHSHLIINKQLFNRLTIVHPKWLDIILIKIKYSFIRSPYSQFNSDAS